MSGLRRNRARRSARRDAQIEPLPRILVVCEGSVTEVEYLVEFRNWCRNPRVEVELEGGAGVPLTIAEKALRLKAAAEQRARTEGDDNLIYDEVWCVFDVDEHPNIAEARQLVQQNGMRQAMSNPCFELWLLLHVRESPGAQHRHDVQRLWRDHSPGVSEKHIEFGVLVAGYDGAVKRAERLLRVAAEANTPLCNPTTEMHHLTNSIDHEGREKRVAEANRYAQQSRFKAEDAARKAMEQAAREIGAEVASPLAETRELIFSEDTEDTEDA